MSGTVFFFKKKKKVRGRCEKRRLSKKKNWRLDGRTGELQEFTFPSCCHTSDMQNKRHVCEDRKKPKEEDRITDDFSEPQTRSDMFEVLLVLRFVFEKCANT